VHNSTHLLGRRPRRLTRRGRAPQVLLTQQGTWGAEQWARNWVDLMRRVYALPAIKGARVRDYIMVDVLNEPDFSWLKCACGCAPPYHSDSLK
jgi:hypothetical protein